MKSYMKRWLTVTVSVWMAVTCIAQNVDYTVVSVPEEAGCDALITKPVTPRELKRQLDRCHRQTDGPTK